MFIQNKIGKTKTELDRESSDQELVNAGFDASANAVFMGIKVRLLASIPYIAPFIEVGYGASMGSLEHLHRYTNRYK
jgi:hypothetical protein